MTKPNPTSPNKEVNVHGAADLFCFKETKMISTQIERLRKDSRELSQYAKKLERKGRTDLVHKILKKQAFIDQHIEDVISEKENIH